VLEMYKQSAPQQVLQGLPATLKKSVARQLVATELMIQEAKKRQIGFDSLVAVKLIDDIKRRFPDSATFDSALVKMGQTRREMWQQAKEGLMVDSMIKILIKHVDTASAAECQDYYEKNMTKLPSEKRFRVSQIMFTVKKDMPADKRAAVAQKAEKVLAEIRAGKDFAAAARKYSDDTSTAKAGGDIGWLKKGDFKRELDYVVLSLKPNEVSSVVQTDAGFIIFKKTGEEALPPPKFDQVKDQIKATLILKKQNDVVTHFIDSLVARSNIIYTDTSYKMAEESRSR